MATGKIDKIDIASGLSAAREKFLDDTGSLPKRLLNVQASLEQVVGEAIYRKLNTWPEDISPNFVELFSELVFVAGMARQLYEHPPLTDDDILGFLGHSISFFNTFTHR